MFGVVRDGIGGRRGGVAVVCWTGLFGKREGIFVAAIPPRVAGQNSGECGSALANADHFDVWDDCGTRCGVASDDCVAGISR